MSVTHSFSVGHSETNAVYSFGRTLPEMLELLGEVVTTNTDKTKDYLSAPLEPVDQISNIIQDSTKAETFYNSFFFGKETQPLNKPASLDIRDLVGFTPTGNARTPTPIDTSTLSERTAFDVTPLPTQKDLFDSHDAAMQYVSRPVCSLEDYIQFIHGEDELLIEAQVEGPLYMGTAVYYQRIKRFRPGPGVRPTSAQTNTTADAPEESYNGTPEGVAVDFPQTRFDWDKILLAYVAQMSKLPPQD